jgi:hypothetical protein
MEQLGKGSKPVKFEHSQAVGQRDVQFRFVLCTHRMQSWPLVRQGRLSREGTTEITGNHDDTRPVGVKRLLHRLQGRYIYRTRKPTTLQC